MDGHFGAWSPWTPCTHTDGSAVGSCLCRTRSCDSPAPQCGGWECEGPRMEIANCSRCVPPDTGALPRVRADRRAGGTSSSVCISLFREGGGKGQVHLQIGRAHV